MKKFENSSITAVTLSNGLFKIFILVFIVFALIALNKFYTFYDYGTDLIFYKSIILISLCFALLFYFGLKLSNETKINLSLLIVTTLIMTFSFECFLEFVYKRKLNHMRFDEKWAINNNIEYDKRSIAELFYDLNDKGIQS